MIASETWRLEMAPLGVRVITLMTGGIATNFFGNLQTLDFPDNSYYKGIKEIIEQKPEQNPYGMKPEEVAQEVLQLVEKGASGKHWVGGGVGIARMALWLLPQSAVVSRRRIRNLCHFFTPIFPGSNCAQPKTVYQEIGRGPEEARLNLRNGRSCS